MRYDFRPVTNCNMCGSAEFKMLGMRLNRSQGLNSRRAPECRPAPRFASFQLRTDLLSARFLLFPPLGAARKAPLLE